MQKIEPETAGNMKKNFVILALLAMFLFSVTSIPAAPAGKAGDEEGEIYGVKWPKDVPKPDKVDYYLPFPAGKTYGQMPAAASHTVRMNLHAIDFGMALGTPICATADGWAMKIKEAGPDRGGMQNCLALQHADGKVSWYLHVRHKGVVPKLGEFVYRGDIVAYAGASGTGPFHLHFSINTDGGATSIPMEKLFIESKSAQPWVSQNKTFDQRYGKELKIMNKFEVGLVLASKLRFFSRAIETKKLVKDVKKPGKDDHPRYKKLYEKIQAGASGLDAEIAAFIKSVQDAWNSRDYETSAVLTHIGLAELKDAERRKILEPIQAGLEKLEDYKKIQKKAKSVNSARKKLDRIISKDYKCSKPEKLGKIIKDYKKYIKKCKDENKKAVLNARVAVLENRYKAAVARKKKQ